MKLKFSPVFVSDQPRVDGMFAIGIPQRDDWEILRANLMTKTVNAYGYVKLYKCVEVTIPTGMISWVTRREYEELTLRLGMGGDYLARDGHLVEKIRREVEDLSVKHDLPTDAEVEQMKREEHEALFASVPEGQNALRAYPRGQVYPFDGENGLRELDAVKSICKLAKSDELGIVERNYLVVMEPGGDGFAPIGILRYKVEGLKRHEPQPIAREDV